MPFLKMNLLFCSLLGSYLLYAQPNCEVYPPGTPCRKACDYSYKAIEEAQGSRLSQLYFDSAILVCPTFAYAWFEKSVPYLKRGDYETWWALLDKAVELEPNQYLGYRAGCLMPTLKDHKGVVRDLERLDKIRKGGPLGSNPGGDYDLRIVLAISKRELGDYAGSLLEFDKAIHEAEKKNWIGSYDYLHRGVTYLQLKNYTAALADFEKQLTVYKQLADTYYYMGLVFEAQGHPSKAKEYFQLAYEKYTSTGFHRNDPYSVIPDQVFLADIERKRK